MCIYSVYSFLGMHVHSTQVFSLLDYKYDDLIFTKQTS